MNNNPTTLLGIMRQEVFNIINNQTNADITYGTVTSVDPLKINIGTEFKSVSASFFRNSQYVEYGQTLKVGDKVDLLKSKNGQLYYILNKRGNSFQPAIRKATITSESPAKIKIDGQEYDATLSQYLTDIRQTKKEIDYILSYLSSMHVVGDSSLVPSFDNPFDDFDVSSFSGKECTVIQYETGKTYEIIDISI